MRITVLLFSLRFQPHQRQKYQSCFLSPLTKTWLISVAWSDAPGTHVTIYTHTLIHSATFKLNQVWAQAARFKSVSGNALCWLEYGREVEVIQIQVPTLFCLLAHIYCQTTFSLRTLRQEMLLQFADTKPSTQDPSLSLHPTGLLHLALNKNTDNTGLR